MLRAEGLRFARGGGRELFGGFSFELPDGCFALVCGANGAGKSTLLDILAGLESPGAGTVALDGAGSRDALAAGTALVPQDPDVYILGEDALEELGLGFGLGPGAGSGAGPTGRAGGKAGGLRAGGGAGDRILRAAERWGLAEVLRVPAESLSPGEKKRLAIASALAGEPRAVLLDEPFSGLDWPGTLSLMEDLARLKATGRTCVVATHEPWLLRDLADAWLLLKKEGSLFTRDAADLKRLPEFGVRPYPGL
ncbi:MAG: energy-coupling factor ABC transporter ATP-binding protein [Deltaproteobacteria bacterium]|jgi:energy-coupling factor transporter ATP-binding protein EcfA2|nr:energy-coupling factor ABC transporter ATP-binding protein [Deltaproteobacteria bacterium]